MSINRDIQFTYASTYTKADYAMIGRNSSLLIRLKNSHSCRKNRYLKRLIVKELTWIIDPSLVEPSFLRHLEHVVFDGYNVNNVKQGTY